MSKDQTGNTGILFLCHLLKPVSITDKNCGRIILAEISIGTFFANRAAMSKMIVTDNDDALFSKEIRKLIEAVNVLLHSVDDLNYGDRLTIRNPPNSMKHSLSVS